jgi:hypothetical protein
MKKRIVLLAFIVLAIVQSGIAQCGIRRAEGFFQVRMPGTIPVDDNSRPMPRVKDSTFRVLVEIAGKKPNWTMAWKNGKAFSIVATKADPADLDLAEKENNQTVTWPVTKGGTIWNLELVPNHSIKKQRKTPKGGIVLIGRCKGKPFSRTVTHLRELVTAMTP